MYHFVKYNNIWYLKPETKQDIMDHYNIILKREFEEGFKDRKASSHIWKDYDGPGKDYIYVEHPTTAWAKAVEQYMSAWNLSWVMAAHKLLLDVLHICNLYQVHHSLSKYVKMLSYL